MGICSGRVSDPCKTVGGIGVTDMNWTDVMVEALKAMCGPGKTASKLAAAMTEQFGVVFSRNMVVGKLTRLGITRMSKVETPSGVRSRRRRPLAPGERSDAQDELSSRPCPKPPYMRKR